MTGFLYSVREAFDGFKRARLSNAITIFTIAFLLFVISVFVIVFFNTERLVNLLHAEYDIQAFISNTLSQDEVQDLKSNVESFQTVESVQYISKQQAAAEFQKEFGDDFLDLLDENPLPRSFVVKLKKEHKNVETVKEVAANLDALAGIDEALHSVSGIDVLLKVSRVSRTVLLLLGIVVFFGSLFVISNTIRLIIMARRTIIETMELVGATRRFIRRPYLIEGMIQGLCGGAISAGLIYLIVAFIQHQWRNTLFFPLEYLLAVAGAGILLGYLGSLMAVKRFL
ncbi:MAG: permease-like cell division protein FtsX [candidate division KSB1 bacterium]|nr:permease-like cell division protein FtsX [candidate division KSB1 bacterium]